MIRIWLDFYEDDMSPWVLSSIHIQRLIAPVSALTISPPPIRHFDTLTRVI
jgi:hypothetical protein